MQVDEKDLEELKKIEESLWISETRFDQKYMNNLLASDFFEFGRSGRIYKREDTLSASYQEIKVKLPLKDFKVNKITDDVFLITYISEVEYDEKEIGNRSSLWLKTKDGWKLKFHQGTPVK